MQATPLPTAPLGRTGMEITRVGFGTWAIGGPGYQFSWGPQDDEDSVAAIHRALALGVNWIDTAAVYGLGHSEEVVGRALAGLEEPPFVFTKAGRIDAGGGRVGARLTRDSIRAEVEASLRRLGVDAIDLYQVHWPDPIEQVEEGWSTFAELKAEGLVRHIGVSNFDVEQLRRVSAIAPVETLQPPYSLIAREVDDEILPFAGREHIGVIVYAPMGSGMLTGAIDAGAGRGAARERLAAARRPVPRAPALGEPRARRAAAGRRQPARRDARRGRRRLDAPERGGRRRDRRLPAP
jgi:aryl-alcohol dehydrogenase-like predicted oxidoreductase